MTTHMDDLVARAGKVTTPNNKRSVEMTALDNQSGEPPGGSKGIRVRHANTFEGVPVPPRVWHVPGLVPGDNVTLISGDGGLGKSKLALQLCAATALGAPWLRRTIRQGKALYFSAEDDEKELHRRIDEMSVFYGRPISDLPGLALCTVEDGDTVLAATDHGGLVRPTPLWTEIEELVADVDACLIVIDAAADVFAINENVRQEVRQAVRMLVRLAARRQAAVVLISHPSVAGIANGSGISGSTHWNNTVRSRLYLTRPDGSNRDVRTLEVKKANFAQLGDDLRLRYSGGAFVNDDASGGIVGGRAASELLVEQMFLELLDAFRAQGREVGESTGKVYAPSLFAADPRAQGASSRGFAAAMARLFAHGKIRVEEHGSPSKMRRRIVRCDAA